MSWPGHTIPDREDIASLIGQPRKDQAVGQLVLASISFPGFVQILSVILTIHFTFLTSLATEAKSATMADTCSAGVGIFGTLFIGANGTFSMEGDLYLGETTVLGKGTLRLNGDSPQRIISQNSKVTNLDLANPSLVTLSGELHVTRSLTVREGTLEADRAQLHLSDSTQVKLLGGAILLVRPELLIRIPFSGSMLPRMVFAPEAVLPSFDSLLKPLYHRRPVHYKTAVGLHMLLTPEITSPPPEVGTV